MVAAGGERRARLLLGCRGHDVSALVIALGGIEIAVGDVHEHVVPGLGIQAHERVECALQMGDLLGGLGFAQVFLGEQVLGLVALGFDGRCVPGIFGVLGPIEGRRLVVELLQLGLGGFGYRFLGAHDIVVGCLEGVGVVVVTQGMHGELPVTGAVGALGQLAALGLGEAKLNAHGLVHPVIGSKLGAVGGKGVGAGCIIAVVGPSDGLHVGAQVAIVAVEVDTQELAIGAAGVFDRGLNAGGSFELLALDAGFGAGRGSGEAKGAIVVRHGLKAVGILVDIRDQTGVGLEVLLAKAAGKRVAIGDKAVACLKGLKIARLDLDRHVFKAGNLVTGHGVDRAVGCRYGFGLAVDGERVAVGIDKRLAVGIVRGVDVFALGSFDDVGALVAAAMQAVIKGRAGHYVKGALVGLVVGVELARRSGGTCRLNVSSRPILGPGEAGIAVGVFLGFRGRRILLVISGLQGVVDGSLDGVGRDGGGGDGVDCGGVAGGLDLLDNARIGRALFAKAVDGLIHAVPVVVA